MDRRRLAKLSAEYFGSEALDLRHVIRSALGEEDAVMDLEALLPRTIRKMRACACKPSSTICASAASHLHFERRADKTGRSAFGIRQFRVNDRNDGAKQSFYALLRRC